MERNQLQLVYAVKHSNEEIRAASRSGGIFTAISDNVLKNGGVVYGCIITDELQAVHFRAISENERDRMRGSKYVQSKMGDIFRICKKDLIDGRKVLFSGTPCQVAGLKNFLNREYDNLVCVDILCHGVPSPAVWEKYVQWQEKKANDKIVKVDFRNKVDFGWRAHYETLWFSKGKKVDSRVYTNLFYKHSILRPCCYKCPFKSTDRVGDISIADYWGVEKVAPKFDDNKGVSLVLVNSDRGRKLFETAKGTIVWEETCLEDSMQNALKQSYQEPCDRKKFWKDFEEHSFDYVAVKYANNDLLGRMREAYRMYKKRQ